jgi:type II secretory pathway component GspD/PulD (secretin)
MKTRVLLSSVLLLVLGVASSAQEKAPEMPDAKAEERKPLHVTNNTSDLSVLELIRWWCEYEKVSVIYQPTQLMSFKVTLMVPKDGEEIAPERLSHLLADALDQFRLCIIEISENRYSIVQATEACTLSPFLDVEAARKAPSWKYVVVRIPLRHSDANVARAALQNLMSRQGGTVNPLQAPQFLLIGDRADRLQRLIDAVEAFEAEGARRTAKTYILPPGISANSAAAGFSTIIGSERYNQPTPPAAAVNETTVVVRATPEQLVLCDELHKQLVAKAEEITAQSKVSARRYDVGRTPDKFVESLEKLFKDQLSVAAVPGANAIIVKANAATHEEVKAALELMK